MILSIGPKKLKTLNQVNPVIILSWVQYEGIDWVNHHLVNATASTRWKHQTHTILAIVSTTTRNSCQQRSNIIRRLNDGDHSCAGTATDTAVVANSLPYLDQFGVDNSNNDGNENTKAFQLIFFRNWFYIKGVIYGSQ